MPSSTRFALCSLEKTQSPISPYTCYGSALYVMGGRLRFLGHAYSSYTCMGFTLDVMDYGLAKAKEFSKELTTRTLLILCIIALGLLLQRFSTSVGDKPPGTTRWYMGCTIRGGPARKIEACMVRLQVVLDIVIVPNRILYL